MVLIKKILLFLLILLIAILFFDVNNSYYSPTKNFKYDFTNTNAKILNLKLSNNILLLPNIKKESYDTIFLKIKIKSTLLGKFINPYIEISNGEKIINSHFPSKSKGIRYINLTSFLHSKAIYLNPHRLEIVNNSVELILFKKHYIKYKRILIIAPHPDDAEIASFGLYSKYHKNIYIVTITAGDGGPPNNYKDIYFLDTLSSYLEKAKLRVINSFTTPIIGGVNCKKCLNLGYFDTTLKKMFLNKNISIQSQFTNLITTSIYRKYNTSPLINLLTTKQNNWNSLVKDLKILISKIKPNIIITPYPAIDAHTDHQYSSIALFEALKKLKKTDITLYLYTNHFIFDEQYPYGDKYSTMNLPPIVKKPIFFQSIFAYPLSKKQQQEKILALDSMNDLRVNIEYLNFIDTIKLFTKNFLRRVHLMKNDKSESYYKRAVRSEELFFIINSRLLFDDKIYQKIITALKKY